MDPLHPQSIFVRLQLPEKTKDASLVANGGSPDSQTSLLLQMTGILPWFENAFSWSVTIPEETEHHTINVLQYSSWKDEDRCLVEMHG